MKALLAIAGHVQQDGKHVTAEDVDRARREGATDQEIHDVVLIAAAFCMFNRYVDGLGTWQPDNPAFYRRPANGQRNSATSTGTTRRRFANDAYAEALGGRRLDARSGGRAAPATLRSSGAPGFRRRVRRRTSRPRGGSIRGLAACRWA